MFEKLKRKHKTWCIIGAVICFLVSGVVAAFSVNDIKTLLLKPSALETLDASDIKENLKVTAKVRYVMDYYAYTETKGQTTAMAVYHPCRRKGIHGSCVQRFYDAQIKVKYGALLGLPGRGGC